MNIYMLHKVNKIVNVANEIDSIINTIRMQCSTSGGCNVFLTGDSLTCTMGDEEICYITQEDGRDAETVRPKLKQALSKKGIN